MEILIEPKETYSLQEEYTSQPVKGEAISCLIGFLITCDVPGRCCSYDLAPGINVRHLYIAGFLVYSFAFFIILFDKQICETLKLQDQKQFPILLASVIGLDFYISLLLSIYTLNKFRQLSNIVIMLNLELPKEVT